MGIPTSPYNTAANIKIIFQNLIARDPTAAEIATFSALTTDDAVVTGIEDLPEAINLSEAVVRFYEAAFGREPDLAGFGGWVNALSHGASQIDVAHGFTGSVEFLARYGSTNVTPGLISAYYQNILHRSASQGEIANWLAARDSHGTPLDAAAILQGVAQSPENIINTQVHVESVEKKIAVGVQPVPPPAAPEFTLVSDHDGQPAPQLNEGDTVIFTLTAPTHPNQAFTYTITGIDANEVAGGSLTGTVTLDANGVGHVAVTPTVDFINEPDETIALNVVGLSDSVVVKEISTVGQTVSLTTGIDNIGPLGGGANKVIGTLGNDFFSTISTLNLGDHGDLGPGGNNTFELFINPAPGGHNAQINFTNAQHLLVHNQDRFAENTLDVSGMTQLTDVTLQNDLGDDTGDGATTNLDNLLHHISATVLDTHDGAEELTMEGNTLDAKTSEQDLTLANANLTFDSFDKSGHFQTYKILSNGTNTGTAADPVDNALDLVTDANTTAIIVGGAGFIDIEFNGDPGDVDPLLNNLATFDGSLTSGGESVNLEAATHNMTIKGGSGNDTFHLGSGDNIVTLGDGDNTIDTEGQLSAGSRITGGAGHNTIVMEDGAHLVNALQVVNFETLEFEGADGTGGPAVYNAAWIGGLKHIHLGSGEGLDSISTDVTFNNVGNGLGGDAGVDLTLSGSVTGSHDITVNVLNAADPLHISDAFTTNFHSTAETVGGVEIHSLEIQNVEFLTFNSVTDNSGGETNVLEELTAESAIGIKVNATTAGLEIDDLQDPALRAFDASASLKGVDVETASAFTWDDPTTHFSAAFALGAGNDTLDLRGSTVVSANGHQITPGGGGDEIFLSTQAKEDDIIFKAATDSQAGGAAPNGLDDDTAAAAGSAHFDTLVNFATGGGAGHDVIDLSALGLEDPSLVIHAGIISNADGTLSAAAATGLFQTTPGTGDFGVAITSDGAGGSWVYVDANDNDNFDKGADMAIHVVGQPPASFAAGNFHF